MIVYILIHETHVLDVQRMQTTRAHVQYTRAVHDLSIPLKFSSTTDPVTRNYQTNSCPASLIQVLQRDARTVIKHLNTSDWTAVLF